jgi:hypothetical protein
VKLQSGRSQSSYRDGDYSAEWINFGWPTKFLRFLSVAEPLLRAVGDFEVVYAAKQRETTLGVGGRQTLNSKRNVLLLLMGGRSFQKVTSSSGQPSWIAYVGVQFLLDPKR